MEPPFPGMDPYLEAPALWPDVHHRLITAIGDQIQAQLPATYRAVITTHIAFERREPPSPSGDSSAGDDASVSRLPSSDPREGSLQLPALVTVPIEYARVEIQTVPDHALVTVIELLSPANKRPDADGAGAYERKRRALLDSPVHLLELDLLRGGQRPLVGQALPEAPYFALLSQAHRRPHCEVWPLSLRERIRPLPVPLRFPDPPATLDLSLVIHEAYRHARYDLEIDYSQPPPPPDLGPDDAAWLDAHLRACGLRR